MFRVGTASWTDKSLIDAKTFYPDHVKTPEERLRYYSSQFDLVEVDSSFYGIPSARNSELWVERTPADFTFNVKIFRLFSGHWTEPDVFPKDIREALQDNGKKRLYYKDVPYELVEELWRRYRAGLVPLQRGNKLGSVLLQFPPWFICNAHSFDHIETCLAHLPEIRVAVEFRHQSWHEEKRSTEVLAFLRDRDVAHVTVDEPQGFKSSIPAVWEPTCAELAIFRLHGRNRDTWEAKGLTSSAQRFNYLYQQHELQEFVGPLKELASKVREVHVIFNNNMADNAQVNARQMRTLLAQ